MSPHSYEFDHNVFDVYSRITGGLVSVFAIKWHKACLVNMLECSFKMIKTLWYIEGSKGNWFMWHFHVIIFLHK